MFYNCKMKSKAGKIYCCLMLLCFQFFQSCKHGNTKKEGDFNFSLMPPGATNITFNNQVTESDSVNFYTNEYMYIGSGVAVGDFNNDGLQDIFFCGSQVSSRLYINKGNFKFEDITEKAGVATNVWCTGVTVTDINNDGLPDIYVCVSHSHDPAKRKNLLFINQGNLTFKEEAAEYGLADTSFSTQAVFFDYDNDGDLDMYLLNHRLYNPYPNNLAQKDTSGNSPAADKLYRNDGIPPGKDHPVFTDVSKMAGIKEDGYGLGVVVSDINNDGWPDIYVANDYLANDLLWLNNKDGTFSNCIANSLGHQSYNSMGVDAADINNDLLPDLAVMDMSPETNERKKTMYMGSSQEKYDLEMRLKYQPEFTRNMLQLNNGNRAAGDTNVPFFSEIAQLAGVAETDWSWSVLFADFDNDGWKDMHVTNGIARDLTNSDLVFFDKETNNATYNFAGAKTTASELANSREVAKRLQEKGTVKLKSYLFKNNRNLTFSNITDSAGMGIASISQGAVYVDLDNDGDLDIVTNNMNGTAAVWRNDLRSNISGTSHNFITVQLKGGALNGSGIGVKVIVYNNGGLQFLEEEPVRGYASCVDNRLHFGIGSATIIDSIKVVWPGDKTQVIYKIKANQFITLNEKEAVKQEIVKNIGAPSIFTEVSKQLNINFIHTETDFFDYANQRALPQKYSQLGPCIATGDVNGDGRTDFFVGGAANQSGKIFLQNADGTFTGKDLVQENKTGEDLAAILFDADGNKSLDLLIAGGSTEFGNNTVLNKPRIYINDGKGNFTLKPNALPGNINSISSAISVADYDGDGDMDIFIGGRMVPGKYPSPPPSYILQNNNGVFTDVTQTVCPALANAGMITGAIWTDFDNDKKIDLIICGEYMPLRFFKNINNKLVDVTNKTGLVNISGLWRTIQQADVDNDGDMDYIVGNLGNNNKYHIAPGRPLMLYSKDMDNNGYKDIVPAYYIRNNDNDYQLFPAFDRNVLAEQVPAIKKKYLLHQDYAKVTMQQLMDDYGADGWDALKCETTSSVWIENLGNGKFTAHALPVEAQFAPINSIVASDVDGDGNIDLIIAGNEYQQEITTGRYDASYGLLLKGGGKGTFTPVNYVKSGLFINGDVKDMKMLSLKNKRNILLAAVNNSYLQAFAVRSAKK